MIFDLNNAPRHVRASAETTKTKIMAMDGEIPELMIMDDIGQNIFGEGIAAEDIKGFLAKHAGRQVDARFNSFGGDAFEGLVIHNAFQEHGNVRAVIDGIAFSAASAAAMGAKTLVMNEASSFGIHRAWSVTAGNSKDHNATIEWLETVDDHLIAIAENRTGASREQVISWMDGTKDGTVFTASQALDAGFADEVIPLKKQRETVNQSKANHAYARMRAELRQRKLS